MKLYIVLKNNEPISNDDISDEFSEYYRETGDELARLIKDEIVAIWINKEDAQLYCEHLKYMFPDDNMTVSELHIVYSTTEWN